MRDIPIYNCKENTLNKIYVEDFFDLVKILVKNKKAVS